MPNVTCNDEQLPNNKGRREKEILNVQRIKIVFHSSAKHKQQLKWLNVFILVFLIASFWKNTNDMIRILEQRRILSASIGFTL